MFVNIKSINNCIQMKKMIFEYYDFTSDIYYNIQVALNVVLLFTQYVTFHCFREKKEMLHPPPLHLLHHHPKLFKAATSAYNYFAFMLITTIVFMHFSTPHFEHVNVEYGTSNTDLVCCVLPPIFYF